MARYQIFCNLKIVAARLRAAIEKTGHFNILSKEKGVPLVAFQLKPRVGEDGKPHARLYDEYDLVRAILAFLCDCD